MSVILRHPWLRVLLLLATLRAPAYAATCTASSVVLSTTSCLAGSSPNYNNYVKRALSYDTSTGIFTGTITTNTCPRHASTYGGKASTAASTPSCSDVSLPGANYITGFPKVAPLRGPVGYSVHGSNIYGPMDAGFTAGGRPDVCTNSKGSCDAGTDVFICFNSMEVQCGTDNLDRSYAEDDCSGHAMPYHYHGDLSCVYTKSAAGHSTLIGMALDGRGIYGIYESTGTVAVLDSCNGHWGDVPAYTDTNTDGSAVSYPAASNVYHYHTSPHAPYTLGCFGPSSGATSANKADVSLDTCKSLYTGCSSTPKSICSSKGKSDYRLDCPCYHYRNSSFFNGVIAPTSDCPGCKGCCEVG